MTNGYLDPGGGGGSGGDNGDTGGPRIPRRPGPHPGRGDGGNNHTQLNIWPHQTYANAVGRDLLTDTMVIQRMDAACEVFEDISEIFQNLRLFQLKTMLTNIFMILLLDLET